MSSPEPVLQEAIQGKLGLTHGQRVKVGQLLHLPTTFALQKRPSCHFLLEDLFSACSAQKGNKIVN
jgi:hypothetical protein